MEYRSEEAELRLAEQRRQAEKNLDAETRQNASREIGSILLKSQGLEIPGVSVFVEKFQPANYFEKKFFKSSTKFHGDNYWKITEVVPAFDIKSAYEYSSNFYLDDSRAPSGTKIYSSDVLLTSDGRIWEANPNNKRSENVYRCFYKASRVDDLQTISMVSLLSTLKKIIT